VADTGTRAGDLLQPARLRLPVRDQWRRVLHADAR
jgi:hypothetical protein